MRRKAFFRRSILLFGLAALLGAGFAPAQKKDKNPLRDVTGVVTDDSGKPVNGAVVKLKNTKTLQIISFITKEQGDYYFHGLSPDIDFVLSASGPDTRKFSPPRTLSSFDSRKQAVINLKLDRDKPSE